MLRLDHLVISAEALDQALPALAPLFRVPLAPGGEHALMGSHNRLLSLGPDEYLEVIAINPAAPPPAQPRWFGLDRFEGPARLTHFVCAGDDMAQMLALAPPGAGRATALARGDLRWQMAVTETGRLPFDDAFPALISWEGSAHPAQRLPDHGLRLTRLTLHHPAPDALSAALRPLLQDPRIDILPGPRGLSARLSSPFGEICL